MKTRRAGSKRSRVARRRRHPKNLKVRVPDSLTPIAVCPLPNRKRRKIRSGKIQTAGCIFSPSTPASVAGTGNAVVCKYNVAGDALSTDSVTFKGKTKITSIDFVPIFFGSPWLTAAPSITEVMDAVKTVLTSPYLSQLGQYGFSSLTLHQPVLSVVPNPPASHDSGDAGVVVWSLIDNHVFPEPDEEGGRNLYMVFYPPGTAVSDISACGWHSSYWGYQFLFDLDWAWVGAVDFPSGATKKIVLDNIVRVFSHELVEMITDPDADAGWTMNRSINGGTEIGDACNNTDDFVDGFLVNAYWSEAHQACVIPKSRGFVTVEVENDTLSRRSVSNGTAHISLLECLEERDYRWDVFFNEKQIVLQARAHGFQTPSFAWTLSQGQSGATSLVDGFSGAVFLTADTVFEDVNGVAYVAKTFPVEAEVNEGKLTIKSNNVSNLFNFILSVSVTASEGAFAAVGQAHVRVDCESFEFEAAYRRDMSACYDKFHRVLTALYPKIPPGDPEGRHWAWEERLSDWISGERLQMVVETMSLVSAFQESDPGLAHRLKDEVSRLVRVPPQLLEPVRLERGAPVRARASTIRT